MCFYIHVHPNLLVAVQVDRCPEVERAFELKAFFCFTALRTIGILADPFLWDNKNSAESLQNSL